MRTCKIWLDKYETGVGLDGLSNGEGLSLQINGDIDFNLSNVDSHINSFGDETKVIVNNTIYPLVKSIDFGRNVHCISVSADGKRLLASATHATGHDNTTLIGTDKGGTARVYDLDTSAIVADLSNRTLFRNPTRHYGSLGRFEDDPPDNLYSPLLRSGTIRIHRDRNHVLRALFAVLFVKS
eukprot:1171799-Prorocentrum_minimum.AAC.2